MVKISFVQGLVAVLLSLLSTTVGDGEEVFIRDIFTVQPGTTNGGCDARMDLLNQWHEESIMSLDVAISAFKNWKTDQRVRTSMDAFFGFPGALPPNKWNSRAAKETALQIERNMQFVLNFLNMEKTSKGAPQYKKEEYWLFCHSTFLRQETRTSTAKDKDGDDIIDSDGNPVPIEDVPRYAELLAEDRTFRPWWAGATTAGLNGYYFTEKGRTYCNGDRTLGGTAPINMAKDASGDKNSVTQVAAILVCPKAFDGVPGRVPPEPNSYLEANNRLKADYNLGDALPKSTTLVHELMHALHGDRFLGTDDEEYDISAVLHLTNDSPAKAQINPESYVFFVAHMYHMFGTPDADDPEAPWSIPNNWDFYSIDSGNKKGDKKEMVFGAKVKGGPK